MAITRITGGVLENGASSGNDVTLTLPTLLEGDVVYLFAERANGGPSVNSAGWGAALASADSGGHIARAYRKIMGATPDTTVVVEGGGNSTTAMSVCAYCLRGVHQSTPEDAAATTATGLSVDPDPPSITTVTNGAWVLAFAASNGTLDANVDPPAGYSDPPLSQIQSDNHNSTVHGAYKEKASAGVEDPSAYGAWAASNWSAITIAVRPAVPLAGSARPAVFVTT